MPGVSVSSSLRHDCPPFLWSIEMSEPTNMANMFWNLDKISETTAIHSGFRLCPIISHSSMRRTIPVAFIYQIPPAVAFCRQRVVSAKSGCLCKNLRKDFAGRVGRSGARAPCGRRLFCFDMRDTRRASALTEALHGEKSAAVPLGRQHGNSRITGGTWPLVAGLSCRTDW